MPFIPTPRQIDSAPLVPLKNGQPPAWVVACLSCGFCVDAHGLSAEDAIQSIAPHHEEGHKLIARPVNYTTGHGPDGSKPHPLYSG